MLDIGNEWFAPSARHAGEVLSTPVGVMAEKSLDQKEDSTRRNGSQAGVFVRAIQNKTRNKFLPVS
jgi:hypothetical protein